MQNSLNSGEILQQFSEACYYLKKTCQWYKIQEEYTNTLPFFALRTIQPNVAWIRSEPNLDTFQSILHQALYRAFISFIIVVESPFGSFPLIITSKFTFRSMSGKLPVTREKFTFTVVSANRKMIRKWRKAVQFLKTSYTHLLPCLAGS